MAALVSKPGITRLSTSSGVPKDWSQSWFRDFISDHLKLADTRNAIAGPGITITGNITSYATISAGGGGNPTFTGNVTISPTTVGSALTINEMPGGIAINAPGRSTTIIGPQNFSVASSGGDYPFVGYNVEATTTSGNYDYIVSDFASAIEFPTGGFSFFCGNSGTAGTLINPFFDVFDITPSGVNGSATFIFQIPQSASAEAVIFNNQLAGDPGQFISWRSGGTEVGFMGNGTSIGGVNQFDFGIGADTGNVILDGNKGVKVIAPATGNFALAVTGGTGASTVVSLTPSSAASAILNNTAAVVSLVMNATGANFGQIGNISGQFWGLGSSTAQNGALGNTCFEWGNTGSQIYVPGHTTTASAANCFINSASSPVGQILRSTSSLRYKTNVNSIQAADINALLQMRPVTYTSLSAADDPTTVHLGFIAEEMALIDPRLVQFTPGQTQNGVPVAASPMVPESVAYDRLTVLLVGAVQTLVQRVAALEAKIAATPQAPLSLSATFGLTGTNVVTAPSVITALAPVAVAAPVGATALSTQVSTS